jgi:hypothetical protein
MDDIIPVFSYLRSNRLYKMLLWKLLFTCASCRLAIHATRTVQELRGLFVQFKSSLSTMN